MRTLALPALFLLASCGGDSLKLDVQEGEVPSGDTGAVTDSEDEDDEEREEEEDEEDEDDKDPDKDPDKDKDEDEDEDEDDDDDDDQGGPGTYEGEFTFGPENRQPVCSGFMSGTLNASKEWTSEGTCTFERGPLEGEEVYFTSIGSFRGGEFNGSTWMVADDKDELETEGEEVSDENGIWLSWVAESSNNRPDLIGEVWMEKQ